MSTLASQFAHAYEWIPGIVTAESSDYSAFPYLLFSQVDSDHGLRNAMRFYWDVKSVSVTVNGSVYDYASAALLLISPPHRAAGWGSAGLHLGQAQGWGSPAGDLGGFSSSIGGSILFFSDLQRYAVSVEFEHTWGQPGGATVWADWSRLCAVDGAEGTAGSLSLPPWLELPSEFGLFYGGDIADSVGFEFVFWTYF